MCYVGKVNEAYFACRDRQLCDDQNVTSTHTPMPTSTKSPDSSPKSARHEIPTSGYGTRPTCQCFHNGAHPPWVKGKHVENCPNEESVQCHPEAPPKKFEKHNKDQPRDRVYLETIAGIIPEKIIETIMRDTEKEGKIADLFGICYNDLLNAESILKASTQVTNDECCTKLSGELLCFLHWLLDQESIRTKRETDEKRNVSRIDRINKLTELYDEDEPQALGVSLPASFFGFLQSLPTMGNRLFTND